MPVNNMGMNDDFVSYFSLEEYIDNIKLSPYLLGHSESTSKAFDEYMKKLSSYDEEYIVNFWIYLLYKELKSNQWIEHAKFNEGSLIGKNVLFDTLTISHKRIHQLHNFVCEGEAEPTFAYRNVPVNVSSFTSDGREIIYWRGVNSEDVNLFMNDFIKIYKQGKTSSLFSNPFLVSALMHLLFLRIHPYNDGNGRTSRIIHNLKFTETINKLYGTRLKISPLNLSNSILTNKITYVKRIDHITFGLDTDTNDEINRWFDFILYMADEQICYATGKLPEGKRKVLEVPDTKPMRLSHLK